MESLKAQLIEEYKNAQKYLARRAHAKALSFEQESFIDWLTDSLDGFDAWKEKYE